MHNNIRDQFPIFKTKVNGKSLVYLDNAATTQKPQFVLDAINEYYTKYNANIHRSSHVLAKEATERWKEAHQIVADFLNADSYKEIVFTRNTTEGLNLLVNTYGKQNLSKGDIVIISEMEHHSNIVPWQILQKEIGFEIKYIPVNENFDLDIDWLRNEIQKEGERIKVVSVVHISNVLGTLNPAKEIAELAHRVGAFMIIDAAQSIPHIKVDVKELDCDALVFSGHKVYGPTGSGVLFCKENILEKLPPYMGGGEMILRVSKDGFEMNELPWRFEAGTPNIESGIVLGETLKWFSKAVEEMGGYEKLIDHERNLMTGVIDSFDGIDWFKPFGKIETNNRYGALTFNIDGFSFKGCKEKENSNQEGDGIVEYISKNGVCVREGFHCAEPL
ncbi:TPA: cysteine desulfurase, partial [Patescibacteria group bacterium]|nr:cysteine desulfurase [Patescibacteria group bacterium]